MKSRKKPLLVAITGGSGSGKTWLADRLQAVLGRKSARLSLDDFYRDRSHLSQKMRSRINFDHPRAIDWETLNEVLVQYLSGCGVKIPKYDFKTHTRISSLEKIQCAPILVVDGLWLLRRPGLRRLFTLTIFIDCPGKTRFKRRMARDMLSRGRERTSVENQFNLVVEPMNARYVAPQAKRAHIVLRQPVTDKTVSELAVKLLLLSEVKKTGRVR